jgi:hypothetical protein
MNIQQRVQRLELLTPAKDRSEWLKRLREYDKDNNYSDDELKQLVNNSDNIIQAILKLHKINTINEVTNER